jgi:hypothetical protein
VAWSEKQLALCRQNRLPSDGKEKPRDVQGKIPDLKNN